MTGASPAGEPAQSRRRGARTGSSLDTIAAAAAPSRTAPAPGATSREGVGRRTVSMPQEVLAEVDGRVGARGFSPYVAEAVRRQLRHDKLTDFLEQAQQTGGAITDEERKAARKAVADAMTHASAASE